MISLLILLVAAAALVVLPALSQFLRTVMSLLAGLVAAAFVIALAIILLVAIVTHGALL